MTKITDLGQITLSTGLVERLSNVEENVNRLTKERADILEAAKHLAAFYETEKCISSILNTFGENLRMYALIETLQRKGKFTEDDMPFELPCWGWLNDTFATLSEIVRFITIVCESQNASDAHERLAAVAGRLKEATESK